MYQLAVVGNPIAHSLSPVVFSLFAKQCGISLNYERILAMDSSDFRRKVHEFFAAGNTAMNVTSPFKQDAYTLAGEHSARSGFCQASNFLTKTPDGKILADTTDGVGLVTDLRMNLGLDIAKLNILILGSGYVLNSVLLDLIVYNPKCIDILARNDTKVAQLGVKFATGVFNPHKQYDLILNSSPNVAENSLFGQIVNLKDTAFCYDLGYSNSLFLATVTKLNPKISSCNGLGMLVEQAKVAFVQLFGLIPDTKAVLNDLSGMGHHV